MSDPIDVELPDEPFQLTKAHKALFQAAGCTPRCHIDGKIIRVGDVLYLKPVARKGDDTAYIMVCGHCAKVGAKVAYADAERSIVGTGLTTSNFVRGAVLPKPELKPVYSGGYAFSRGGLRRLSS